MYGQNPSSQDDKQNEDRQGSSTSHRRVLVVDADASLRRLIRLGLEIDGAYIFEADSMEKAREYFSGPGIELDGIVIGGDLPDGNAIDLVNESRMAFPRIRVIVLDTHDNLEIDGTVSIVKKGDIPSLIAALSVTRITPSQRRLSAVDLIYAEQQELIADWHELCQWDPMLPPDSVPPNSETFIAALCQAMGRPQPLGWGADPEIEKVAKIFAEAVGSIEIAIGEITCLREALTRRINGRIPVNEITETNDRLQMILDRAIGIVAGHTAEQLKEQAYVDTLTGLFNRRALERDLRREIGRASRYERRFTLMIIDLDGLKKINDSEGHAAGDQKLKKLGDALRAALRSGDSAYRIGGDEFVLLLPETTDDPVEIISQRITDNGAPAFSWGAGTYPDDGEDLVLLLEVADKKLFETKRIKHQTV